MKIGDRVETNDGKQGILKRLGNFGPAIVEIGTGLEAYCWEYLPWQLRVIEPKKPRMLCLGGSEKCHERDGTLCARELSCTAQYPIDSYAERLQYAPGFEEPKPQMWVCEKAGGCPLDCTAKEPHARCTFTRHWKCQSGAFIQCIPVKPEAPGSIIAPSNPEQSSEDWFVMSRSEDGKVEIVTRYADWDKEEAISDARLNAKRRAFSWSQGIR
jgi:hypothetical protein